MQLRRVGDRFVAFLAYWLEPEPKAARGTVFNDVGIGVAVAGGSCDDPAPTCMRLHVRSISRGEGSGWLC
jgi:hypothetical protein